MKPRSTRKLKERKRSGCANICPCLLLPSLPARSIGYYLETAQSGHYSGRDPTAKPASGPSPSPSPTPPTNPPNMYVADLSSAGLTEMPGLQFSGIRATRARFPNGGLGECAKWVWDMEVKKQSPRAKVCLDCASRPTRIEAQPRMSMPFTTHQRLSSRITAFLVAAPIGRHLISPSKERRRTLK